MADTAARFRRPFSEQVAAYRLRLRELRPTFSSADPRYAQHSRAFMVAGAVKADLLADLAAAVDRAVTEGTGFEAFKKDFREIVERRGWHGWTGEDTARGREWRMRTIYRTNMRTSYMAGRHAQLVDGNYRWWVYRHSGAAHPRLDHLSWDGVALPPDHPFWALHFPPNGWGCGCDVEGARTEAGIRRMGGDPGKTLPPGWDIADPRTGLPPGIGKGWAGSPAEEEARLIRTMARKTVNWPTMIGKAYMEDVPAEMRDAFAIAYRTLDETAQSARRYAQAVQRSEDLAQFVKFRPYKSFGLLTSDEAARLAPIFGAPVDGYELALGAYDVRHILERHGNAASEALRGQRGMTPVDLGMVGQLFANRPVIEADDGRLRASVSLGSSRYTMIFERLAKRRMLRLVTMYRSG